MKTCDVEGCGREKHALGKCWRHYQQLRLRGYIGDRRVNAAGQCGIPGCFASTRRAGRGFCKRHWFQRQRYGDPLGHLCGRAYSKLSPDGRRQYEEAGRVIRGHLRDAMSAYALGDIYAARRFVELAEQGGRPLTMMEREVAEAIRSTPDEQKRAWAIRVGKSGKRTVDEIAQELGESPHRVRHWLYRAGIADARDRRIVELARQGLSAPEIAQQLGGGMTRHAVRWVLMREGMLSLDTEKVA